MSAEGWCPLHDHVYPSDDGLCPECGTALVAVDETRPTVTSVEDDAPEEAAGTHRLDRRSPWLLRGAVAAAVAAAFTVGLAFPRAEQEPIPPRAVVERVSQDERVSSAATSSHATIRLDRVQQRDDAFTATFSALDGFPEPMDLRGVSVEAATRLGGVDSYFGVSEVTVTPNARGFRLDGTVQAGAGRIVGLTLSSIQFQVGDRPEWALDLSRVWPVRGAEPRVLHVGRSRPVGEGSLRLVSIVAWRERLEAAFELSGLRSAQIGSFDIEGLVIDTLGGPAENLRGIERTMSAVSQEQISPSEIVARFLNIPADAGRVTIRASRLSRFLTGPWHWRWA